MPKLTDLTKEMTVAPAPDDLLHIVDVSDTSETPAGSSYKIKKSLLASEGGYDATVGAVGSGGDYNDIQDAINAAKYNLLVIGTFTQPTQINNGSNFVKLTIAERLKFTTVNFAIGSAGIRIRSGEIETSYTSGSNTLFTGTGTLDLADVVFFDSSTGGATVSLSSMSGIRHLVNNCKFVLANNQNAGFNSGGNESSFTNLNVIGGGSSCNGFVRGFSEVIIDDVHFSGTWDFSRQFILSTVSSDKFIMTNCLSTAAGDLLILLTGNKPQLSNLTGRFDINLLGADNGIFSDLDVQDLIYDISYSHDWHYFTNCKFNGTAAITLYGDYNQFVNCNFNAAFTLPASSSNNQLLQCVGVAGFVDNGTNNVTIEAIKKVITPTGSDVNLVTEKAVYDFAASCGMIPVRLTVPGDGATSLTLPSTVVSPTATLLIVRRNVCTYGVAPNGDYTISGTTLTWNARNNFTLETTDEVIFFYTVAGVSVPPVYTCMCQPDYNVNYSLRRARQIVTTGSYRMPFGIPEHFTGTLKVELVGFPVSGAGGAGKNIDLSGEYTNAAGQNYQQYTFADTTSTYNTGTDDTQMRLDITSLLPNIAPGSEGGILVDHKSIGGPINYVGILITSTL